MPDSSYDQETQDTTKLNRGAVRRQTHSQVMGQRQSKHRQDDRHRRPTPRTGGSVPQSKAVNYIHYGRTTAPRHRPSYGNANASSLRCQLPARMERNGCSHVMVYPRQEHYVHMGALENPNPSLVKEYGKAAAIGAVIGIIIAVIVSWFLGGYAGMMERRSSIAQALASAEGDISSSEWHGESPAISWNLLYDDETSVTRAAILEDITNMRDAESGFGIFSWPSMPYFVGDGHASDCHELMRIVDGIYSDYPELSVYTNGQCVQTAIAGARYMLPASENDTPDQNKSEYAEVSQRLDDIATYCDSVAGDTDMVYITEAYRQVAENCIYAQSEDDPHANDIYGALIGGQTKCYGGSCALKALLDRRGIPSFLASGQVHGDPSLLHAWNIIWYDSNWYVCDTTCSMGSKASDQGGFYWGCLKPLKEYLTTQDILIDDEDEELMEAYENLIGVEPQAPEENDNTVIVPIESQIIYE